jgi:hypothetical protein
VFGLPVREARKRFFFEKKNQKTFVHWHRGLATPVAQLNKSFLRAFFQKSAS